MIAEQISIETGLPTAYVRTVARTASHRYKTYEIPKATGGSRTIDHPARELKFLQQWIVSNIVVRLPVHDAAYAYRTGRNILSHASLHANQNYLLKLDFRDFFPSITGADVSRTLKANTLAFPEELSDDDRSLARSLVCKQDRLTIGAPSSPALSNAIMFDFDNYWAEWCKSANVVYSRYSDDLYFSTNVPNVLSAVITELRNDLSRRESPRLHINDDKTAFTSRKRKRLVTGLVLTSDRRVSLGRPFKRRVRSLVFQHGRDASDPERTAHVRGLVSYALSVEPRFVAALQRKFGENLNGLR